MRIVWLLPSQQKFVFTPSFSSAVKLLLKTQKFGWNNNKILLAMANKQLFYKLKKKVY